MRLRIRNLPGNNDYTQKYVASYFIFDQSLYSKYERGERAVPLGIMIKLAKLYNTSIDYLAGLTGNPEKH